MQSAQFPWKIQFSLDSKEEKFRNKTGFLCFGNGCTAAHLACPVASAGAFRFGALRPHLQRHQATGSGNWKDIDKRHYHRLAVEPTRVGHPRLGQRQAGAPRPSVQSRPSSPETAPIVAPHFRTPTPRSSADSGRPLVAFPAWNGADNPDADGPAQVHAWSVQTLKFGKAGIAGVRCQWAGMRSPQLRVGTLNVTG
jgi:hypothetical protein